MFKYIYVFYYNFYYQLLSNNYKVLILYINDMKLNKWYEREIKDDIHCNSHNINDRIQNIKKYLNFIGH